MTDTPIQQFTNDRINKSFANLSSAMYQYQLPRYLPTADELPNSDDTPVDNELQEIIPNLLKSILRMLWKGRMDWFFGIDMGIYTHGFLSLNVERSFDENLRLSYLLWEEEILPLLVLEVVSAKPGGEYTTKLDKYAELGVLYYVIYNPKRRRKARLEIHKLSQGQYELQNANPLWMPEIGLGIGCERANYESGCIGTTRTTTAILPHTNKSNSNANAPIALLLNYAIWVSTLIRIDMRLDTLTKLRRGRRCSTCYIFSCYRKPCHCRS
jgi:Uma2 family endonuclease